MAPRHADDRDSDANRRTFLKTVGATGALALGGLTAGNVAASSHDVNLADRGLASGDRIDPYLDGSFSNETVLIPAGEYRWDGALPSLSNATLRGHPDGVAFNRPSSDEQVRSTLRYSGNATLENVTIRGKAGSRQSRADLNGSSGAHLTVRNVNLPDGSVEYSDSYAFSAWDGEGTVTFERCYIGDFGNAACYMEGNAADAEWRECVFINGQNAVRPPAGNDGRLENCVFIWRGDSTYFCEGAQVEPATSCSDCGGGCGRMARGIRIKHDIDTLEVRGCRFYMGQGDISYGPCIDLREEGSATGIVVENCRFYNHGDFKPIRATGDMVDTVEASNLRVGGPGAGLEEFSDARVGSWNDPDLTDVSVWHTGDGRTNASVSAANPEPNTPDGTGNGDGSGNEGDERDPFENRFVVAGATANATLDYRFWVDGDVSLATGIDGQYAAETGDEEVSTEGDLTVVTGTTDGENGDAFAVDGDVLAFERTGGNADWQLFDDGVDVTDDVPASLPNDQDPLAGHFAVMSTTPGEEVRYEFWVDGDASLATDLDGQYAAETGDEAIAEEGSSTRVTGSTGNEYGDAFDCSGAVVGFRQTGGNSAYQLLDDGEDVTEDVPAGPPGDDGDSGDTAENRLVVRATTSGAEVVYRFWVDGDVALDTEATDDTAAESGDEVITAEDPYTVVTGSTGNGYGDAFQLDGELVAFARTGGNADYQLRLGGEPVSGELPSEPPNAGPRPGTLLIDGTEAPDETARYTFTVSGTVEFEPDRSTVRDGGLPWDDLEDAVGDGTATGIVGNGVDAYAITGELEEIDIRGPAQHTIERS